MEYLETIKNKIDENWDEEVSSLQELIGIRTVAEDKEDDMPFGSGVDKAFKYVLEKGTSFGFDTKNVDNYGGHIEFGGYNIDENGDRKSTSDEVMGIVGHLDTVPEGNDWSVDPFSGICKDGKMYGRGTTDDKGPTLAALYAMKALSDSGIIPQKKVRLILGLDEETNWYGMDYYLSKVSPPDFGITPDAEFPAINGEMGILVFDIAKKFGKGAGDGITLKSFKGGFAPNMVADFARVVINAKDKNKYEDIKKKINSLHEDGKYKINSKAVGKSLEITMRGVSSHGARPELGTNAISQLMEFLQEINFNNEDVKEFIEFYNKKIGFEVDGKSFGCGFYDEPSGKTILNVGMIDMDTKSVRLTINVRYPVTFNEKQIYDSMDQVCTQYNLGIVKNKHQEPIYIPKEDPFIKTLMEVYAMHTGDTESQPMVIGGGTYARAFKNVIAFGSSFPNEKDVAHQKDEFIDLEQLKKITLIYADTIYRMTCC